jgi:tetratricopeptide (TPR) repeat protein
MDRRSQSSWVPVSQPNRSPAQPEARGAARWAMLGAAVAIGLVGLALPLFSAFPPPGALTAVDEPEIFFDGTGPHTRPITTQSATAQQFFNQGLNFLFAFNHAEARRSFRAAARHDPNCAMAWWGLAVANGPHINFPMVPPEQEKEAVEAVEKASTLLAGLPEVERDLIQAAKVRYRWPQVEDRSGLDRAYAGEMRQLWAKYPADADIGALFAESMMNLRPWDLWTHEGEPQPGTEEIIAALDRVLELNPRHPFGLHLYIHAVEASPEPRRAAQAADALRDLQPGLGHNQHMPSHIDIRLGNWKQAIAANEKAIIADRAYRARRPQQALYRIYMTHNHHMLAFAAMMSGRSALAIRHIDTMLAEMPEDFKREFAPVVDGFFMMAYEVRLRFGRWDEVLAMPEPPEFFPTTRAFHHAARAVAYAAKKQAAQARQEQQAFLATRGRVPEDAAFGNNRSHDLLKVAEHLTTGEILMAEGRLAAAVEELRQAVKVEDTLRYDEPPDWIQPTRHALGVVLLVSGRYQEALEVYREDLKRNPNNGWSLYGLAETLEELGHTAEAEKVRAQFQEVWAEADTRIHSSCLCVPLV